MFFRPFVFMSLFIALRAKCISAIPITPSTALSHWVRRAFPHDFNNRVHLLHFDSRVGIPLAALLQFAQLVFVRWVVRWAVHATENTHVVHVCQVEHVVYVEYVVYVVYVSYVLKHVGSRSL